jgi:hypothetical protein
MTFRKSILFLFSLSMIATLAACGGGFSTPPPPLFITVRLSTTPTSLYANGTIPVTATVANDSANQGVTWSCAPAGSCGTFSSPASASGTAVTYTAPATVPARTVVITATSLTNTAISASTPAITINATAPPPITVTLSTVPTPAPTSLVANGTLSITATVANDSANGGVTWSCTPGNSAATCGSFSSPASASGTAITYTAPATAVSAVTITATSVTNPAVFASLPSIAITAGTPPITVTLSPTPTSLYVNDTTPVTATVANDSANRGVTWSCAPVGSCGRFSSPTSASGVPVTYTAPASVPTGSVVVIIATSVTNPAVSASTPAITINATVISVALTTAPPTSLFEGGNTTIAATVTGDPAGLGVNWTCTPAVTCGSFNPTGTASAGTTVYTAGTTAGPVVITATSVSDNARNASANVTIARGLAAGTYVFSLSGTTTDGYFPYRVSGAFTVLGGMITGGEQDFVYYFGNLNDLINPTGSSISPTADGNLQITLLTCNGTGASACAGTDTNIGVNNDGIEVLAGSVLPLSTNGRTFITEFDGWATSGGELDIQDPTAATMTPSLGYAFGLNGLDSNGAPISIGGIINVDNLTGTGTISGTNSIFDANDDNSGVTFKAETFRASNVSTPEPGNFGRVLFTLNPTDNFDFPEIGLAGYIVDANRIRLVETFDGYFGTLGGTAFSQGAANTGQFSSASVSGNSYVVGMNGYDGNGVLQVVGLITPNSGGTVSGFVDFNDLVMVEPASPDPVTAPSYIVDPTGRVTITGLTDTTGVADFNLQLYLDGNGHALAITMDSSDTIGGGGSQQSPGVSFTAASFSGGYGMDVTGWDMNYDGEFDAVGPLVATGSGGTITGTVDLNWLFSTGPTYPGAPVSGTFLSNADGIFTGTFTGVDTTNCVLFTPTGPGCSADVFNYYLIDAAGDNIAIETDTNQLTFGFFAQQ